MMKRLLSVTIMITILLIGCGKASHNDTEQPNGQTPTVATPTEGAGEEQSVTATPIVTELADTIDYNQYIRKVWVDENGSNVFSFCISRIENGTLAGSFNTNFPDVPNPYYIENLTGTINNDTAECQFYDTYGNKGNITLIFKPNDVVEATLKLTDKAQNEGLRPQEGTYQFRTYNLKDLIGFRPIEDQSFTVDLDSWGTIKFVSGKLTAGEHIPTVFYLTNEAGDFLYDFNTELPYNVDVKAVSFHDMNKDGRKDVSIIVTDDTPGNNITAATVYFQNANGIFVNDPDLDMKINESGSNKDMKSLTDYLVSEF